MNEGADDRAKGEDGEDRTRRETMLGYHDRTDLGGQESSLTADHKISAAMCLVWSKFACKRGISMLPMVLLISLLMDCSTANIVIPERDRLDLCWDRVSCSLNKKGKSKVLLRDVCGQAKSGRLLAIMGPSGSGKTTLLNAISGQMLKTKGLALEGMLQINGMDISKNYASVKKAYVRQDDIFYTQMTVRETLRFTARLRLPKKMNLQHKFDRVEEIIKILGLQKCSDTLVGGGKNRGISGGEKKRLNIACELIASPSLIFLDEPTTGLDSFQADKVVRALKSLTERGHTVVAVIHQPSGNVFNMFDDLLLLSEGRQIYHGEAKSLQTYLFRLGQPCPSWVTAGEHALNLISINHESAVTEESSHKLIDELADQFEKKHALKYRITEKPGAPSDAGRDHGPESSLWEQVRLLFGRSWREISRNKGANIIKAVQQVSTALIYGSIYSFSNKQSSIQDRFGLCSLVAIGNTNLAIASTIRSFPKEKVCPPILSNSMLVAQRSCSGHCDE
eukprot:766000-Hanusia_phi.AAC.9